MPPSDPGLEDGADDEGDDERPASRPSGGELVLLAEDEPAVRRLLCRTLEAGGYRVLEASNGLEALELARSSEQQIDLLMTDVVMARMGGPELADELRRDLPDLPILYLSGYPQQLEANWPNETAGQDFMQKPFRRDALLKRLRGLLERAAEG